MQPEQLGRYRVTGVLGRGGMGVVYEGHDPQIDRVVAIKTIALDELSEEERSIFESRFRAEMRSAGRLQHQNIVALYDTGREGGTAYIVMERVQGQDLKRHLSGGVRFSVEQSVDFVLQLLSALEFAHSRDVIHRDVKPANVMLQSDGVIKLCDFGVARLNDADATRTQGMVVGSLRYSSPEQVSGQPVDARTDVFATGVLLFELLTGRLPFEGGSDVESLYRIAHQQAPSPRSVDASVPAELDSAVARALARDPKDRFASAAEFAVALGGSSVRRADTTSPRSPMPASVAGGGAAASTAPPGRPAKAAVEAVAEVPKSGRRVVAAAIVGVLLVAFAGLYYGFRPSRAPEPLADRQAASASTPAPSALDPVPEAAVAVAPAPLRVPASASASATVAVSGSQASASRVAMPTVATPAVHKPPTTAVTAASPADGSWLATLSCGASLLSSGPDGKAFVGKMVVDVKGEQIGWVRSDKAFVENVKGTIGSGGHILAAGEGSYAEAQRGRWRVEAKGDYRPRERLIEATVQLRRFSDSALARECALRAERSSASSVAAKSVPAPSLAAAPTVAKEAPAATAASSGPADGSWHATLSCGALMPPSETDSKGFVAKVVVDVKGPRISWVRSDKTFTETLEGTISGDGRIVAAGEGRQLFADGQRAHWHVEANGEYRSRDNVIEAAVQQRRWSDSSLARECTLRAEHP